MLALFVGMFCPGGMGCWAFSELKEWWRAWICGIKTSFAPFRVS